MGLLDFIQQDDGIRLTTHSLSQLATLFVAHISWRRSDESRHRVTLLILRHIDTHHSVLVVKQELGQSLCQLSLTHTRSTHEDEGTYRPLGILQARTATTDSVADGSNGLILTHHTLVQLVFEVQQLLAFALHHLVDRDACPTRHNLSHIVGTHFFVHQRMVTLGFQQVGFSLIDGSLSLANLAVAQLSHTSIVAVALGHFSLVLVCLNVVLLLLDKLHIVAFGLPFGLDGGAFVVEFGYLLPYLFHLLGVVLALDGLALNLQLADGTLHIFKLFRHRVDLQPQTRGGLVDQVDGLVGQETVADVTHRQLHGRDDGLVQNTDVVVGLVTFLQATEDADGRSLVRLIHHDLLETTLQCFVLLEILLVFLQGGGTDGTEFTTR